MVRKTLYTTVSTGTGHKKIIHQVIINDKKTWQWLTLFILSIDCFVTINAMFFFNCFSTWLLVIKIVVELTCGNKKRKTIYMYVYLQAFK